MRKSLASLTLLLACGTVVAAHAGESADVRSLALRDTTAFRELPVTTLDTLITRASRLTRLMRSSGFVKYIDVAREGGPAEQLGDVLEREVGLSIRRYGGPGAQTMLSIRGLDPGYVEIFLDRVPLRSAARGGVNLTALDLSQIEAIEIYRSAPPSELGGETSGAAIRLISRSAKEPHLSLSTSAGSFGTRLFSGSAAGTWRRVRTLLSASRFATDGDFAFYNTNGTAYETSDDAWETWTNGDHVRESLFARVDCDLPWNLRVTGSHQANRISAGVPGTGHLPTRETRLDTDDALQRIELGARVFRRHSLMITAYGYRGDEARLYRDPARELAVTGTQREVEQEEARTGRGLHMQWLGFDAGPLGSHSLELLTESRHEELRQVPPQGRPEEDRRKRDGTLLSLGNRWESRAGRVQIDCFYRWEVTRNNYDGVDPYRPFRASETHRETHRGPRIGLRFDLGAGHTLKANYAEQARFPTFSELFGYAGTIRGNPSLKAERGIHRDVGWLWDLPLCGGGPALQTELAYHEAQLDDMIAFVMISDRETKPENLDKARIRGLEWSATLRHVPLGPIEAALTQQVTWQATRDEGVSPVYYGKQLPYHPPWRTLTRLDLTTRRFAVRYAARHCASTYWSRSNLAGFESAAYWEHEMTLRATLMPNRLGASLRIENLLDQRHEDIRGYPLPGRAWYSGLDLTL